MHVHNPPPLLQGSWADCWGVRQVCEAKINTGPPAPGSIFSDSTVGSGVADSVTEIGYGSTDEGGATAVLVPCDARYRGIPSSWGVAHIKSSGQK